MDDGSLTTEKTAPQAAAITVFLAERACELARRAPAESQTSPLTQSPTGATPTNGDQEGAGAGAAVRAGPTPLDVCTAIAEQALDAGRRRFGAELLFAALRRARALPARISTGFPVQSISDIAGQIDDDVATFLGQYLLAAAERKAGRVEAAGARLNTLLRVEIPIELRAATCAMAAQLALARGDFEATAGLLRQVRQTAPDSPIANRLETELAAARGEASLRERAESRIIQAEKSLEAARSAAEAAGASHRLADAYLAQGDASQAAGVCIRFSGRWPDYPEAPAFLSRAMHILGDAGEPADGPRLAAIRALLTSRYPSSPEAALVNAEAPTTRRSAQ
jgi:tetratricopeptide (TPR) repeat protein